MAAFKITVDNITSYVTFDDNIYIGNFELPTKSESFLYTNVIFTDANDRQVRSLVVPAKKLRLEKNNLEKRNTYTNTYTIEQKCALCSQSHYTFSLVKNCPRVSRIKYDNIKTWKCNVRNLLRVLGLKKIPEVITKLSRYISATYGLVLENTKLCHMTGDKSFFEPKIVLSLEIIFNSIEQYIRTSYIESFLNEISEVSNKKIQTLMDENSKHSIEVCFLQFQIQILRSITEFIANTIINVHLLEH